MDKVEKICVKCGVSTDMFLLCALQGRLKCNGIMCVDCGLELTQGVEESEGIAICPCCELEVAQELEDAGLYYTEDGGDRTIDSQLWKIAFRVVGTPLFNGLGPEKIHELLTKQHKEEGGFS